MDACPIWETYAKRLSSHGLDGGVFDSARAGGVYSISNPAIVRDLPMRTKLALSSWILQQNRFGVRPPVSLDDVKRAHLARPLSPPERATRILEYVGLKAPLLGQAAIIHHPGDNPALNTHLEILAWSESDNINEVFFLFEYLQKQGFIEYQPTMSTYNLALTMQGHAEIARAHAAQNPGQAFVAMWFSPEVSAAYDQGIEPAIREAGYEPVRIDRVEHSDKVDDAIIAKIRSSRFVVADFTSEILVRDSDSGEKTREAIARGGVYFEAGFALGLEKKLIWTCRHDLTKLLHFDTRQYNHITWDEPADLRSSLKNRILAWIGQGPHVSRA